MWFNKYFLNKWTRGGRQFPNLDCWGLIVDIYRDRLGIVLDDYHQFTESNMTKGLIKESENNFIKIDNPENYDIACWITNGQLKHVGIYINNYILHADRKSGTSLTPVTKTNEKNIVFYRHWSLRNAY